MLLPWNKQQGVAVTPQVRQAIQNRCLLEKKNNNDTSSLFTAIWSTTNSLKSTYIPIISDSLLLFDATGQRQSHAMPVYPMQVITSFSIPSDPIDLAKELSNPIHGPQPCCVFRRVTEWIPCNSSLLSRGLREHRGDRMSQTLSAISIFILMLY